MKKNPVFWIVAIAGIVLDQLTKYWIVSTFGQVGTSWAIIPNVFHLTYVTNTGAAFSFFRGGAGWLKWLSLGVSLGLMVLAWRSPKLSKLEQTAYGFILAGALGNGIDRFFLGHVTDFLHFRLINFPIFNLADVWINVGIICLLLANFPLESVAKKRNPPS
ncbi:MAG: signal peptidase II [Snowella sp.]|nr:signal peptidase II [Snowella sp.]